MAAIARSDGTRASITRALFATRLTDARLAPPRSIDHNGDTSPARIPVYRNDASSAHSDPLLPPALA
jgi:hypothetical protein